MEKELVLTDKIKRENDKYKILDGHRLKTKITAYYTDTGEEIFTRHNMLTIAGGAFLARALFDINNVEITPSYNTALNLDGTINTTTTTEKNRVYLFCVGKGGCGRENSQVYAEKYASWITPENIVPLQYLTAGEALNEYEKKVYFGKKTGTTATSYYFKRFDSDPRLVQQLTDGTPIDGSIYDMVTTQDAETIVTMQLSISKSDCRDYFINTTGLNDARINQISLCTAWLKTDDHGNKAYQDIRPATILNFPNEPLIDTEKAITISYSVYF